MEPTTTGAAGTAAGWKLIGGTAGALGIGASIATVVVMLMSLPRSPKEWTVGLISTVMGSICGGAFVIQRFSLQSWMGDFTGLLSVLGIAFACGLPGWAIVRWIFNFIQRKHDADIAEIAAELRKDFTQ